MKRRETGGNRGADRVFWSVSRRAPRSSTLLLTTLLLDIRAVNAILTLGTGVGEEGSRER